MKSSHQDTPPPSRLAVSLRSGLLFTLCMALVFPAYAAGCYGLSGKAGIAVAAVAAITCWSAGFLALIITGMSDSRQGINGLLLSMIVRTGVPLGFGTILQFQGGWMAQAHVMGTMFATYLLALSLETWLSVRLIQTTTSAHSSISKAS